MKTFARVILKALTTPEARRAELVLARLVALAVAAKYGYDFTF